HRPSQAVIRAVTCFGILLAGAACFTAFHGALGDGPPAHRFRLRPKLRPTHVRTKVLQEESSWIYPTAYNAVGTYKKKSAFSLTPFYVVRPLGVGRLREWRNTVYIY